CAREVTAQATGKFDYW
nr:immunoglobulin heavy chain junction region [Mus musculus]